MADMDASFSDALERLRVERGLSAAQLARALNEYEGNVSRWRHGKGIDQLNVWKVADFFGVDRAYLERLAGYGDDSVSGEPEARQSPRLAAFIAQVENAFHSLTDQEWQIREEAGRALFAVPPARGLTNRRRDPVATKRAAAVIDHAPPRRHRAISGDNTALPKASWHFAAALSRIVADWTAAYQRISRPVIAIPT